MDLTSEENKAIEWVRDLEDDKEHLTIEQRQAINIILNLVEKQQKEIEEKDRQYDSLVNVAIEAVFSEMNEKVEILARVLHKQGQIKFDKERQEYINPMKEFELFGAKYTKNKVILDEENYIPKDAIIEKIDELKDNDKNDKLEDLMYRKNWTYYELFQEILKELLGE